MPEELRVANNDDRQVIQCGLNVFVGIAPLSFFNATKIKIIQGLTKKQILKS